MGSIYVCFHTRFTYFSPRVQLQIFESWLEHEILGEDIDKQTQVIYYLF